LKTKPYYMYNQLQEHANVYLTFFTIYTSAYAGATLQPKNNSHLNLLDSRLYPL